jgi:uncharacterized protein YcbK (DUF882 family)
MVYGKAPTVSGTDDYEAQYDCDTLQRAADIMRDPNRVQKAKDYAAAKVAKLKAFTGESGDTAESSLMKGYRTPK